MTRSWIPGGRQSACPAQALIARALLLATAGGLAGAVLATPMVVSAQQVPSGQNPAAAAPQPEFDINFQDADIRLVISALAEMAGLTVAFGGLPERAVTLRSSTPVAQHRIRGMLEAVARANGLVLIEDSGLLRIASADPDPTQPPSRAADGSPQGQESGELLLNTYRLRHVHAATAAEIIKQLFGQGGRPGAGVPAERTTPTLQQRRERLENPLGANLPGADTSSTQVAATRAAEVRGPIQVVPEPGSNALLIRSTAGDWEVLRRALEQVDVRPLQVLIEVLIVELRGDREFSLGLDVTVPETVEPRTGARISGNLDDNSVGDLALRILDIGRVRADVVISALAARSNVRVLSRPLILTQNNEEARILIGSQRPFVQVSRSLPTDAAVRDQVVQYRDVGTELTITPTISPDGYVTLRLLQEVSGATTETQFGAPIISTREVETQLFLRNQHTAVIGGLVDRQQEHDHTGIPLLSEIPLLGNLFRSTHTRTVTTELFLLLTPHVIRSDEDLTTVTREVEAKSQELRHAPELESMIRPQPAPANRKQP